MGINKSTRDTSYVSIPTTLLIAFISSGTLLIIGLVEVFGPVRDDKLPAIEESVQELREADETIKKAIALVEKGQVNNEERIKIWQELGRSNAARIEANRQALVDGTKKRWSSDDQEKYSRQQAVRDTNQDRTLEFLQQRCEECQNKR